MTELGVILIGAPALVLAYAYSGYPLLLSLLSLGRRTAEDEQRAPDAEWPLVSVCLPAYNEEDEIRGALEALLAADYPADRRQILVVSDASSDRTDEIVSEYRNEGVELLRVEARGGKTAAENAAVPHLRGDMIVNTDASVRVCPGALKALARALSREEVGVASGRDVSVGSDSAEEDVNLGEAGYVGYEMWVRRLETGLGGIVGASGCLYAIRRNLHAVDVPDHLSRDFCAALTAREHGYRAVSVPGAVCEVPRTDSLVREFRRKVRTITRGLQTLVFKRHLLNPLRHSLFAWKLGSHKLARWMGAALSPLVVPGLLLLSLESGLAAAAAGLLALSGGAAVLAIRAPEGDDVPRLARIFGYLYSTNAAAAVACWRALRDRRDAVWEPTRR